jgi:uncharacterized membrane protein
MWKRFGQRLLRRKRFNLAALLFIALIGAFSAGGMGPTRAIVLAFAIASAAFLGAVAWMFSHSETASIRVRARKEDQGLWGLLLSSVAVTGVVLVALGLEMHLDTKSDAFGFVLASVSLLLSWLFMNTMFALHYAHAYYGDDQHNEARGGLDFPGEKDPDYWDFAYFAMVIGMTFQVSDVQICARHLRHIALLHSVIAFFFNVIIIALTVNIVAGKA